MLEPRGRKTRAVFERRGANRCNGGVLAQTAIGQSSTAVVGVIGNRLESDNLVKPRRHQPTPSKRGIAHRADVGNLVDVQTRKRLAPKKRL